jgi:6-pyruvoyl-tetrahydropterin synthase
MSGTSLPPVIGAADPLAPLFAVGTSASVVARHRLPDAEGPERDVHPHEYRVEVTAERSRLNERGMVCDLDVLRAAVRTVLDRIEGRELDAVVPAEAGHAITVEVLARFIHDALSEPVRLAGGDWLSVRVWESPTEFGAYRARVS